MFFCTITILYEHQINKTMKVYVMGKYKKRIFNYLQRISIVIFAISICIFTFFTGTLLAEQIGVPINYQLPADGALPKTYLVTLALTDLDNSDWIVSTFVAGEPRTVTKENGGMFTEVWDGLDENFMPVIPGEYGIKGIYSSAEKWDVDGEYHSITPKWVGGVSDWLPSPDEPEYWKIPIPFYGDPCDQPLADVDVASNGVAVFYYKYLENGKNLPMFDLNKPISEQFIRSFNSGGAGGGPCAVTDGDTVWAYCAEGGPRFIYRADGKPFGKDAGAHRRDTYVPEGWVTSMAIFSDPEAGKNYIYAAQGGRIFTRAPTRSHGHTLYLTSETNFVDKVTVLDGADGKVLGEIKLSGPKGLVVRNNKLYVLSGRDNKFVVSYIHLDNGLPIGDWGKVFDVPGNINPFDLELDSSGRFYLSDREANKVYQLNARGKELRTFGNLDVQKPGEYDPETLMNPGKLATWRDKSGKDRLIIVETAGPNRVSEWSADEGKLLREYPTYQTKVNIGYAIDPDDSSMIYIPTQDDWLTRFKVDYDTGKWRVDAVWPGVEAVRKEGLVKPWALRKDGVLYLASGKNLSVYRLDEQKQKWFRSAGLIQKDGDYFFWNDSNGNGEVDDELRSTSLPGAVITYHGQRFLPDFSYIGIAQRGRDVWRLAPDGFDSYGNPIFKEWQKILTDPIFEGRINGTVDAVHGGNELAESFSSDWMMADGSVDEGFYIHARGGKNFTANFGAQHKISRYVPDGQCGYKMKWRVGRSRLGSRAAKGELTGGMRIFKPINGLLTVIDQSRSGLFLYTDDGLFVDTIFPTSDFRGEIGVYRQPGEFFAGNIYANIDSGKIYYASGKYTPFLYEMESWSLNYNPVESLKLLSKKVSISSAQIADPPEIALVLRGEKGKLSFARFSPALGGVSLDGSLTGWESADTISYGTGKQNVEVLCMYDPDNLYLRWHVRLQSEFRAKPLPPLERIFTHDQGADTVSFYIQGDQNVSPAKSAEGRPGDVRMVFGLFKDGETIKPVALGMYPDWAGKDGKAQTYQTPVGSTSYANVDAVKGAKLSYTIDKDGKGFVLVSAIPRTAVPAMKDPFSGQIRTLVNFSANLGGHNKFWWANIDGTANSETYDETSESRFYPGCWAPASFKGIIDGFAVKDWLILGPFGGEGVEKFSRDPQNKKEVNRFFESAVYPPDTGKVDINQIFSGSEIDGYWKKEKSIKWSRATIADLDTRVTLGLGAQVWYGVTWIYSPKDTEMEFDFQGHKMTYIRWFLNGEKIDTPADYKKYEDDNYNSRLTTSEILTLKGGWNKVFFRSYNVGYVPFRIGLVLKAPTEILWKLRFSNKPEALDR